MIFEWDPRKAVGNSKKHGVSFEEAATAFLDPEGLDGEDLAHSKGEARRLRLAKSGLGRVLLIAYTTRRTDDEEITRIISARRASRKERKRYEVKED
ncbi:MAG: BrnT family toxin [Deltaproteobacteria bacterium]|nr:BrnT family toxin [Deltaproteobacteria bacterium]